MFGVCNVHRYCIKMELITRVQYCNNVYITAGNIMLDTAVSFLAMWVYLSYFTTAIKDFIILLAAELK